MSQPSRGHPRWLLFVVSGLLLLLSACNLGQQPAPEEPIVTETPTSASVLPTRTLQGVATSRPSPTPIPFNTSPPQSAPPTSVAVVPPTVAIASTSTQLPISVVVVSPIPGNVVSGNVQIVGSATHPDFLQYRLEFGPDPNPGNLWYPITGSVQSPVIASNLGVWNTTTTPDGIYQIRLRVFLRNGTELTTRVQSIRVRNQQPTPIPTATPDIPRPIVSFTTSIDEGTAPLVVTFQNQSQGQINSYSWDFGDGGSSTQPAPTYVYQNPGTYQATLRVTGPGGTSNVSKQIIVNSPSAPVADFTPSQTSGPTPLNVTFNNLSQGQINSVEWDFGDGSTISTQTSPTHTFTDEGTYNVILRVIGPGGTDTAVQQITVSDPQVAAPQASFQASQTNVDVPALVTFTNTSTGQANQYLWDFNGDGTTDRVTEEQSVSPVFEYITPGTYTVRMTATGEGGQDTTTVTIVAQEPENAPNAAFTVSTEGGFAPLSVQFTNNTEGDATEYRWNFGNGVTSQAVSPSYTYEDPGNYVVELTAIGPGGRSRAIQTIRVQPRPEPPEAGFAAVPAQGVAPLRVDFNNQSEGSQLTYQWDFQSDGVIDSQESNPVFTYDTPGQYTATLRVIDPGGQTDTASQTIDVAQEVAEVATDTPVPLPTLTYTPTLTPTPTITPTPTETPVQLAPPQARFTADPPSGTVGVTITFNSTSAGEQISSYEWDFNGDGQLDHQGPGPVTYKYEQSGSYEASLLVRNPAGIDTVSQTIVVDAAPSATPTFTPVPSETPVPSLTPTFTAVPSETPVPSLTPTFTPLPSETPVPSLTPTFTPVPSETPVPSLTPTFTPIPSATPVPSLTPTFTPIPSATPTEAINVPVASFTYQPQNIIAGTEVSFTSTSTGQIDSYQWDFNGDGQIDASGLTVTHSYAEASTYNVSLTVSNTGGSDTAAQSLEVLPPRPVQPTNPPPQQDERSLLVVSNLSGNPDIYAYTLEGTEPQNLTNNPSADIQAAWSPDKSQVAFVSNRDGVSNIYVLTLADGSVQQLTAESGNNSQPAWSPDGSQIAFVSDRFGDNDIFVMNPNGAEQVQRTTDVTNDRQPVWSPNGSRIAYVSNGAGNADIYVMNAIDGSNQTQLTTNTGADTDPAWSPDGSLFVYTSVPGDVPPEEANADLYLMNTDGSNPRPLTANPSNETNPVWSPDGTVVLFLSDRGETVDVFRITLESLIQEGLLITPNADESDIDW